MTETQISEIAGYVKEIGVLKAEIERLQGLSEQIAQRLYLASECLAAAAKRSNLTEFQEKIEAWLAEMQKTELR